MIGLGTMGSSLALNLADKHYTVHVYNRTYSKTEKLVSMSSQVHGYKSLDAFIGALSKPRKIIMMVSSGNVIDLFLRDLAKLLDEDDIVVDGGNSYFKDTIRRSKDNPFNFVGCGISGGEYGARHGPSMMIGCDKKVYESIKDVFEDISSRYNGVPCCGWLGDNGAGHFVKIVHNGIEYCEMQLLQEVFNMLVNGPGDGKRGEEIDKVQRMFDEWNGAELSGYLVGICAKILAKRGENGYTVDDIVDRAEQKGTGKMCIFSGIEESIETPAMAESVMARFLSSAQSKRIEFSEAAKSAGYAATTADSNAIEPEDIRKAFYLCKAVSYIQGFNLLLAARHTYGWEYQLGQICDIWRDGCILRCSFLDVLKKMSEKDKPELSQAFLNICSDNLNALKRVCRHAIENDIYAPVFASCLMWLNGLRMHEGNGSLIQAMRDYFGRHGVVLKSGDSVNIEWEQ